MWRKPTDVLSGAFARMRGAGARLRRGAGFAALALGAALALAAGRGIVLADTSGHHSAKVGSNSGQVQALHPASAAARDNQRSETAATPEPEESPGGAVTEQTPSADDENENETEVEQDVEQPEVAATPEQDMEQPEGAQTSEQQDD